MSRYLLDTHILLWWLYDDPKLPEKYRQIISKSSNTIVISVASLWEIEIKRAINKLIVDPLYIEAINKEDFILLNIEAAHVLQLRELPVHHNDPFDRILISQAQSEKIHFLSVDKSVLLYDISRSPLLK